MGYFLGLIRPVWLHVTHGVGLGLLILPRYPEFSEVRR